MARKKAKRKQCRKSNLIYFVMKCTKPVLCALVMKEVCGTQTKNQENILKNYLQQHRHQIAKQLKDIDYEDAYMNILFPPNNSLTNLEKWDLTLLRFVLEKIVKIGETISYYLTRLFDVVTELRRPNSKNCTRVMYAKNRQVLMQMRSKCYKKLKDHRFKDKVERDARKIDSRNQPILKGDTVLEKWIHTEEQTIKEVLKYGQQRYDCIKQLLLKTSGDVLRTLVLEMVKRKGNRSLDDFLHKDMQRILRRLNGKSNEQMDILFPRNNKKTEISKWDVSLLCFILADVCNLDSKSWRSITAIRRTRNELFHRSDCKLSEKCYHSSRKTIEKSLNHCLTVINDKSLTETVKKQMGRIYHCPVEDKEMKELLHKVDLHERDVLAILQRKQEVFDDICSNLKDILKCLGKEQGSELEVELVIRNCPEDQESAISDIIVTAFNEKINDALNGVTCLDETEHRDLKEAVSEIVEMLESKGVTVLRAVKGSVLLKLHCKSFTKACELYDSYKVERCAAEVLNLQIFIRKHIGFDVTLTMAIYENSMLQCIKKTVSSVKKSVRQMEFAPVRSSEPGKNCLPSVKLKLKRRCEYTQCTPDLTAGILEQLEAMSSTLRSQFDIDIFSVCTAQQPLEKMQTVLGDILEKQVGISIIKNCLLDGQKLELKDQVMTVLHYLSVNFKVLPNITNGGFVKILLGEEVPQKSKIRLKVLQSQTQKDRQKSVEESIVKVSTPMSCRKLQSSETFKNLKYKINVEESRKKNIDCTLTKDELSTMLAVRACTLLPLPVPKIDITVAFAPQFEPLMSIIDQIANGTPPTPHISMRYEFLRFCTLRSYPKQKTPYLIKLAEAGIYYASDGDGVVCYCCGVRRYNWVSEDNPMKIHERINPNCKFLRENEKVNVPVKYFGPFSESLMAIMDIPEPRERPKQSEDVNIDWAPERIRSPAPTQQNRQVESGPNSLGIHTAVPKHTQYAMKTARKGSYSEWPDAASHTPHELADAGFFYAGFGDCVRCFYCGIGLRHWTKEDNQWIEHARWSRRCVFLKQMKGEEFVNLVQIAVQYSQDNEEQSNSSAGNQLPLQEIERILLSDAAQSILEMGYLPRMIKKAIEQLLRQDGNAKLTAQILMEKVLETEEAENPNQAARAPTQTPVEAASSMQAKPASQTAKTEGVKDKEGRQAAAKAEKNLTKKLNHHYKTKIRKKQKQLQSQRNCQQKEMEKTFNSTEIPVKGISWSNIYEIGKQKINTFSSSYSSALATITSASWNRNL